MSESNRPVYGLKFRVSCDFAEKEYFGKLKIKL